MTKEIRRLRELAGLNRGDKFVLNELFDKPYAYEWTSWYDGVWKAEFKTVDGDNVIVCFEKAFEPNAVRVEFERNKSFKITGQKDQFRIFATVLTIMKDFMKNNGVVKTLYISSNGSSRTSLYRRMLKRFVDENNFNFEENKYNTFNSMFTLSRKD